MSVPGPAPAGTGSSRPQTGQVTVPLPEGVVITRVSLSAARLRESQELPEPAAVEADYHLVADQDDGRGPRAGFANELLAGGRIACDVLRFERNPFGRKKLSGCGARRSPRGRVDDDLRMAHRWSSFLGRHGD